MLPLQSVVAVSSFDSCHLSLCHLVWAMGQFSYLFLSKSLLKPMVVSQVVQQPANHAQSLRDLEVWTKPLFLLDRSGSSQLLKGDEVGGSLGASWRRRILRPDQHVLCTSLRAMIQTLGSIKSVSSAFVCIISGNMQTPSSPILGKIFLAVQEWS